MLKKKLIKNLIGGAQGGQHIPEIYLDASYKPNLWDKIKNKFGNVMPANIVNESGLNLPSKETTKSGLKYLAILFIILLILVLLYFLFQKYKKKLYLVIYYKNNDKKKGDSGEVSYLNNLLNTKGEGNVWSYSLCLKINKWYSSYGIWKNIFRKGNEGVDGLTNWCSYSDQCPGLYFHDWVNNIRIVFTTSTPNGLQLEYFDINNIPINEQFSFIIVCQDNTAAIYLNGDLVRTCVFKGKIKYNSGPINFNSPQGFNGYMKNIAYYDIALNDEQIREISECKVEEEDKDKCKGRSSSKNKKGKKIKDDNKNFNNMFDKK